MKAATGELNLTVITIIAIAAVIGFFWIFFPRIRNSINNQWDNAEDSRTVTADGTAPRGTADGTEG